MKWGIWHVTSHHCTFRDWIFDLPGVSEMPLLIISTRQTASRSYQQPPSEKVILHHNKQLEAADQLQMKGCLVRSFLKLSAQGFWVDMYRA